MSARPSDRSMAEALDAADPVRMFRDRFVEPDPAMGLTRVR